MNTLIQNSEYLVMGALGGIMLMLIGFSGILTLSTKDEKNPPTSVEWAVIYIGALITIIASILMSLVIWG